MTKSILKSALLGLLAVAVTGLLVCASAKDTNAPAAEKKEAKTKKPSMLRIHGKLKAVDQTAKTVSVGEPTIQITSETKISKGDKPATLEDGVVGEEVSGAYKKGDDGKLTATKLHFGQKAETTEKSSKAGTKKGKSENGLASGFFKDKAGACGLPFLFLETYRRHQLVLLFGDSGMGCVDC